MTRMLPALLVVSGLLAPVGVSGQTRSRTTRVDPMTAGIRGIVVTADTGAPIRGAEVRVASTSSYRRLVTTDGEGHFDIRDLPGGEYRLTASRAGFTSLQYGQRRPLEAPTLIRLSQGEQFTANVGLPRGAAIVGRVFDHFGEPLAGLRVQVLRSRMVQGQRRLQGLGLGDRTDDTGAFRIYGLPPGDYYVTASPGEAGAATREPPIFYPGTPSFTDAIPVRLAPGGEAGADFQIPLVRNARVSGIVLGADGAPMAAMVRLASEVLGLGPGLEASAPPPFTMSADSGPDGRFAFDNVPPGPYVLGATAAVGGIVLTGLNPRTDARQLLENMRARLPEAGSMRVVVPEGGLTDLALTTSRGGSVSVRYVADAGVIAPLPSNLGVSARSDGGGTITFSGGVVAARSESHIMRSAGPFRLDVTGLPEDWYVKSILVDGVDMIDRPIDVRDESLSVQVVLSDRASSISGVVQSRTDTAGRTVVVFSDDSSRWTYPSRYVRTAKTDEQGRFVVTGLPPGERYQVVAVDFLEDGDEQDPDVLERLRARSTSLSLGEDQQRSVWLDLVTQ